MATTFTSATLSGTYDDDFDKDKNFHQILFNSGRALQSRELTQLQTMIYQEIGRLGRNIFKEGAAVSSGGMAINSAFEFIKVASVSSGGDFTDIPVGTVFSSLSTNIRAKVVQVVGRNDSAGFTSNTLYVQYIDAGNQAITTTPARFNDGETIYGGGYELVTTATSATGRAAKIDVATGDFFVLGRFVHASNQTLILNPYAQSYTGAVGFKVVQEVINVNDDQSLYDNTGGVVNTASPGADRYRIRLTLSKKEDLAATDTFVFLCNVENSKITEKLEEEDQYNKINDLLALRTSEESGDYLVEPFQIHFEDDDPNDTNLELIVSSGTGYVNGYRVDIPSPTRLSIPKPTGTETINNDVLPIRYGNYFLVDDGAGIPDLTFDSVNISTNASDPSLSKIGKARIRAVEKLSTGDIAGAPYGAATHKAFVFDVEIFPGYDIKDAQSIGSGTSNYFSIARDTTGGTRLFDVTNNDLLMPTVNPRVESMSDIVLRVQRYSSSKTVGSGTIDISDQITPGTESFVNETNWIVSSATQSFIPHTATSNGVITVDTSLNGTSVNVLYYVQKTANIRTKTKLDDLTATLSLTSQDSVNYYQFPFVDIYDVDSARRDSALGVDILSSLTLDDGQRDNFYQRGRVYLTSADSAPSQIYVKYSRLQHNNDGDFFAAPSYNGMNYEDIPVHVTATGKEKRLFNHLDFRSDNDNGTWSNIMSLPRDRDNVTADVTYYLPRADKLLLTQDGELQLLMGQQDRQPQYKLTPDNALELYKIRMNPNTLNEDDLSFESIDHPHYTMKDIAELEAKVDDLAEFTKLSINEINSKLLKLLDSAGNIREEVGEVSDDGTDHTRTDTENPDHSSSIDPESGVIRPECDENNIRLKMDETASDGVIRKGDNVYLNYTEEEWAYQDLASTAVTVNPFGSNQSVGTIKLSPSSDEWKETANRATRAIYGRRRLSDRQSFLWNNWQWNWMGRSVESRDPLILPTRYTSGLEVGKQDDEDYSSISSPVGTPKYIRRVVASDTLRKRWGKRYLDIALIPWIRSRRVFFHAKGLKPNTKFTPFFDGLEFSSWCREESTFLQWSERDDDQGNLYKYAAINEYPSAFGGPSDLVSDANGEIIGSFFIPSNYQLLKLRSKNSIVPKYSNDPFRFRVGVREFMLLDISEPDWNEAGSKAFAYYAARGHLLRALSGYYRYLRWPTSTIPYSYLGKRIRIFSSKEIVDRLNQVNSGEINIVDAFPAGSFTTGGTPLNSTQLANYDTTNTMSFVLSDFIVKDQNHFASDDVNPDQSLENPLSQTFTVDNPFGLVLTKVDLFFRSKDTGNLPVSIQIRPVENGKPSETVIIPDSQVFLNPSQVTAIPAGATLSNIQANPTTFTFDEPVHLEPNTEYAIVVTSSSTEYEVYSAQTQQTVLGSTSRTVTTQPAPGSLFLPQNGTTWKESKDQDLMFRLTRADFSTNGSLILKNVDLPNYEMSGKDDIRGSIAGDLYTTKGKNIIVALVRNHGLEKDDTVTISNASGFHGFDASEINGEHTVSYANSVAFCFRPATGTATETGFGGGKEVQFTQNQVFKTANLKLDNTIPRSCSLDVFGKFTSGSYICGNDTRFVIDQNWRRIVPEENIDFATPVAIYNSAVEQDAAGLNGERSVRIKVDFKSADGYVSPIIDLQRSSLIMIGEHIDIPGRLTIPVDHEDIQPIQVIPETQPSGGNTACTHIMTPVKLPEPAVGISCFVEQSLPTDASVDFYYRTAAADQDITQEEWIYADPTSEVPNRTDNKFERAEYLPGGVGGDLKPFNQAQIKFALKGGSEVPVIRNMQIKYLAV